MSRSLAALVPEIGASVDWHTIDSTLPWIAAMRDVPQDPIHHAEGDVWIHTRMVCESLVELPAWRAASREVQIRLFVAALLHDVGKPHTTVTDDDGRVRSPGHSPRGAVIARKILWTDGWPASLREPITALVRFHQVPYHLMKNKDARGIAIRTSQTACSDDLAMLCEADVRGRTSVALAEQLDNIELFRELCRELGCYDRPYAFASDHARAMYFHRHDRDPQWAAYDDTRVQVTVMAGLPASGKSTWAARHGGGEAIIALDDIRAALDASPKAAGGAVVGRAKERARELLRAGRPFVWDATNLVRSLRSTLITLLYDYGARVRIVHLETDPITLRSRNRGRARIVPNAAIDRMLDRWEMPDRTEAHEVLWIE